MICIFVISSIILINTVYGSTSDKDHGTDVLPILNQPVKYDTYYNKDYGIKLLYPDNWIKLEGDLTPGDYITNIVLFKAPFDTDDKQIRIGKDYVKELRGHQFIRFAIYISPSPLENTQHDLDLYLQDQLISYKQDKNEKILNYTSHNIFLGGPNHPAFQVHLTFKNGKYDMEQLRTGTIIDGNMYYVDYSVFPENYQSNLPVFKKVLESVKFDK